MRPAFSADSKIGQSFLTFSLVLAVAASAVAAETSQSTIRWDTSGESAGTTVYRCGSLWTGDGEVLDNAALVVRGGKVISVTAVTDQDGADQDGADQEIQPGWRIVELPSATVVPGLVVAETGLLERGDEERTLSPEIRAIDGFDFFDEYDELLATGITTVQIAPGRDRLLPGQGAVVKLAGKNPMERTVLDSESLRIQLTRGAFGAPTIYEPPVAAVSVERPVVATRFQFAGDLPAAILTVGSLWRAASNEKGDSDRDDLDQMIVDEVRPFVGKPLVRVTARSEVEILAALELMKELDQPFVLIAPERTEMLVDELVASAQLRGIVFEHDVRPGRLAELPDPTDKNALEQGPAQRFAVLRAALPDTIPIALKAVDDSDLDDLIYLASSLVDDTTTTAQAFASVTSQAAKVLGLDQRVGRLAAGCDADFVVMSGPPLAPGSTVMETFVDGQSVYRREPTSRSIRITGATVRMADGSDVDADISIDGTSIRGIGPAVSHDPMGRSYPLDGCYITAGLIDVGTGLGAGRTISNRISLGSSLGEYLAEDDDAVRQGRIGGVTTGLLSSTQLPSPVVAFKLSDTPRVLQDPVAIRMAMQGNPTTAESNFRKTLEGAKKYADQWDAYDKQMVAYREALTKYEAEKKKFDAEQAAAKKKKEAEAAKKAAASKSAGDKSDDSKDDKKDEKDSGDSKDDKSDSSDDKSGDEKASDKKSEDSKDDAKKDDAAKPPVAPKKPSEPRKISTLEPYRSVFKKEIPLIIDVSDRAYVVAAIRVADEFSVPVVFATSGTADDAADSIAEKNIPVMVEPPLVVRRDGKVVNLPQIFELAGCRVMMRTLATTNTASLPQVVSHSVMRGWGGGEASLAMTVTAADVFKLPKIGQLKVGYDADLTVFSGPPFHPSSRVVGVMIDGQWVYLDSAMDPYMGSKGEGQ